MAPTLIKNQERERREAAGDLGNGSGVSLMKPHTFNGNNDTNFQLGYHSRLPSNFILVEASLPGGLGEDWEGL